MSEFMILGGDWGINRKAEIKGYTLIVHTGRLRSEKLDLRNDIERVEFMSEEEMSRISAKRLARQGLLALLTPKDESEFRFSVYFKDGRKFLGMGGPKVWQEIQQATF